MFRNIIRRCSTIKNQGFEIYYRSFNDDEVVRKNNIIEQDIENNIKYILCSHASFPCTKSCKM